MLIAITPTTADLNQGDTVNATTTPALFTCIGVIMKPHVPRTLLFSIGLMVAAAAGAQGRHDENGSTHGVTHTTGKGTVTQIDVAAKRITLDHEAIRKLKLDAGSHDFQIRSEKTVATIKAGDKVDFSIEARGNAMEITRLSKQK